MRRQSIMRFLLFVCFFSVGATVLSATVLCADFIGYYRNRQLLQMARQSVQRLESLNADYDALLEQMETDPTLMNRAAAATLAAEPNDPDAAYPRATAEQLAAAQKALCRQRSQAPHEPKPLQWLKRCSQPRRRIVLFMAGAFLVLLSFVFFAPASRNSIRHR